MSANSDPPVAAETWGDRAYREWERFWFRPADPTLLGLIRIGCGLIVLYSMIACAFDLQNFVGEDGWLDLETTLQTVREGPYLRYPLKGIESPIRPPSTELEKKYLNEYMLEFKQVPPAPYPQDDEEKEYCHQFRRVFKYDLRYFGLLPPSGSETKKKEQREFLEEFAIVVSRPELFGHSEYFNQPPAPLTRPQPGKDRKDSTTPPATASIRGGCCTRGSRSGRCIFTSPIRAKSGCCTPRCWSWPCCSPSASAPGSPRC